MRDTRKIESQQELLEKLKSIPDAAKNDAAQHMIDWLSGYNVGHAEKQNEN